MNRPAPISVFSDQHRTKSTTRSRTSCGTHTLVRAPQDFFLRRCARPSTRPTPRLWSGSSSPGTRSVAVRLDGPVGSCQRRPQRHSRRTLFANDRILLAAVPVHHTDRKPALYPTSAASGWQPSLLRCSPIKANVKRHFSPSARCRHFFVSAFSPTALTCTRDRRVVLVGRRSFVLRFVTRNGEIFLPPCGSISRS